MKSRKTVVLVTLTVVAITLAVISASAFASAASNSASNPNATAQGTNGNYYPNGMMGGGWGGWMNGMMGGNWGPTSTTQTPNSAATQSSFLPLIGFAALIGAALTGTGGAIFYFAFPKAKAGEPISPQHATLAPVNLATPYSTISKTLTEEERKVLDVLVLHNGKYLQKYIRAETGMSRLKTHRIVMRLAERGIVTFEKTGNTNEVHLSAWLQTSPSSTQQIEKIRPLQLS